jgi:bacterioferritin-associated ferredoxin
MYVCICQAITDRQIESAIKDGAQTFYDLKDQLGVGSCCGSCQDDAESIIARSAVQPGAPAGVGRWRPAVAT